MPHKSNHSKRSRCAHHVSCTTWTYSIGCDNVLFCPKAVAIGLGGKAVAATLAALCLNFKHFGGGLPDLLLMRAVRTTSGEEANDNSGTAGATSAAAILDEQESSTVRLF